MISNSPPLIKKKTEIKKAVLKMFRVNLSIVLVVSFYTTYKANLMPETENFLSCFKRGFELRFFPPWDEKISV
jgi:VIT1/CCC1 family predicted Fe2+/Mn2+ transporter